MKIKHKRNSRLNGTVFTQASKLVRDSVALSFGRSAQDNCDPSCRLWHTCYAARIERFYGELAAKLDRHFSKGPLWLVCQALRDLPADPIRWARLSVDGSLPSRGRFSAVYWHRYIRRLRQIIKRCSDLGAKWHIPVESMAKARTYRAALRGLGVCVRRTVQSERLADVIAAQDCVAVVVGRAHNGGVKRTETEHNGAVARGWAREVRRQGKTAVVCSAIVRFQGDVALPGENHCGDCTACADERVDVVLLPFHA